MVSAAPTVTTDAALPKEEGGIYRWYVVAVLFIGYCFSAIDARVLTLMVGPIKQDLGLSDFEISLLQGFAFSLLYSMAAIPIGRFVDSSSNRAKLVVVGVIFWSLMTMACGMARNFLSLFLTRVGVGIGEATLSPTAYSLISDYFERNKRALAISLYAIGYPVGGGLALIIGGALLGHFTAAGGMDLGFLGHHEPWQMVFIAVGLPGIIVALLIATIREPKRRELAAGYAGAVPLSYVTRYVRERWKVYGMLIGSLSLIALLSIGTTLWYPTFLIRTYGMNESQVGLYFGMVMLVCGTIGTIFGGWLSGRLMQRGRQDANMQIVLFATILKGLPIVIGPLMPNATLALTMMGIGTLVGQASQGVMLAALQDVTPNQLRGQVTSVALLAVNLIGMGLGASVIAGITDFGFGDESALRYSIALTGAITLPLIVLIIVAGMGNYRRALTEVQDAG